MMGISKSKRLTGVILTHAMKKLEMCQLIIQKKPFKRFRNTFCPYQMTFKVSKILFNGFCCEVTLEQTHNYPINSLEALSFKFLTQDVKSEVLALFAKGLTPSQAHKVFVRNLMNECEDDLTFHLKSSDRSKCPRRRDFNSIYIKYCQEVFGGRNGPEMFEKLEKNLT